MLSVCHRNSQLKSKRFNNYWPRRFHWQRKGESRVKCTLVIQSTLVYKVHISKSKSAQYFLHIFNWRNWHWKAINSQRHDTQW